MILLSCELFGVKFLLLFDELALTLLYSFLFLDHAALFFKLVCGLLRFALFLGRHQLLGLFKDGTILLHDFVRICTTRYNWRLRRLLLLIHTQPNTMIILQLLEPCEVSLKFLRCLRLLVSVARAQGYGTSLITHVVGKLRRMHLLTGCHSRARYLLILHNAMAGLDHGIRQDLRVLRCSNNAARVAERSGTEIPLQLNLLYDLSTSTPNGSLHLKVALLLNEVLLIEHVQMLHLLLVQVNCLMLRQVAISSRLS